MSQVITVQRVHIESSRYLDEEYLRRELDRGLSERLREGRVAR